MILLIASETWNTGLCSDFHYSHFSHSFLCLKCSLGMGIVAAKVFFLNYRDI